MKELSGFERFMRSVLDDWIAPLCPSVSDLDCFEPRVRRKAVVLEVPGVTQVNTYTCGATASWSVLRAMGWKLDFEKWLKTCHDHGGLHPDEGMDEPGLDRALRRVGARLKTTRFRNYDQVRKRIDQGLPILFGWDDDGFGESDHWLYAYGYARNHVYVGNIVRPGFSKGLVTWGEWETRLTPREIHVIEEL